MSIKLYKPKINLIEHQILISIMKLEINVEEK